MQKDEEIPHAKECGARCRTRAGARCRNMPMTNGRCRMHGGRSTGPKTRKGRLRIAKAVTKHGAYAKGAREAQKQVDTLIYSAREFLK